MRSWEKLWGVPHFLWEDFKLFKKCKLVGGGGGKGDTNSETLLVGYIYPYCVWISVNGCFGFWGVGHVPVDVQPIFMSFVTFSSSLMPLFQGHAGARSIHTRTYTPVYMYSWNKLWKNYTLFISWKSLFASFNRDDWYIFHTIFVSLCWYFLYLLLFLNSDGVTAFFPINTLPCQKH